jgi:hypothetical protein
MELIGILILIIIGFVFFGILGWLLKILGYIFEFLLEGFFKSLGCLFWVFIIFCILAGLCS